MTVYDLKFKLVLLGDPAVGKTSLMNRFVNNMFSVDYATTIGAKFLSKAIDIENENKEIEKVMLSIWDIAGQPRFMDLRTTFYRGANGALFVFDLTRQVSLENLNGWYTEMVKVLPKETSIVLIGNKLDLAEESERKSARDGVKLFLKDKNAVYIETSAKTGDNVEEAFKELTYKMAGLEIPKELIQVKEEKPAKVKEKPEEVKPKKKPWYLFWKRK